MPTGGTRAPSASGEVVTPRRRRPANRGKPARKLTPRQRRLRRLDRDPLYDPSRQLAGRHLSRAAEALVDLEYRPRLGALKREQKTAESQGAALSDRASGYYRDLANREATALAGQQALSERTRANLAAISAETHGQIGQAEATLHEDQKRDVSLRGEGLGGGEDRSTKELAAARFRAAESGQAFRSAGELQGANYEGLQALTGRAQGLRGGEVQQQLATGLGNTLAGIRARRSELESSRGAARTKTLGDLRQSAFENLVTVRGLGLKEAELRADVEDDRGRRKLTAAQQREARRHNRAAERIAEINASIAEGNLGERQRHNLVQERQGLRRILNQERDGDGKSSRPTPTQRRGFRDDYSQAQGLVRSSKS